MTRPLRIGIVCHPSVGGSGILASELGEELATRGHEIHFVSHSPPFRMSTGAPRIHFHQVEVNSYDLFKYPDYTLPLSVKLAEVSTAHALDILHVHYTVPHATAAMLAMTMLPKEKRPKVVVTMHGTDVTLLGCDAGYAPAIQHALEHADSVTTVSQFLQREMNKRFTFTTPVEVIPNFFTARVATRAREIVRAELGLAPDEALLLHMSNLRPIKRIDLLLETLAALAVGGEKFKLVVLAGGDFEPHAARARELGLTERILVRDKVTAIEDYLQAADVGVFTSQIESFCLSILEAATFACPSVAFAVGGIPEVITSGEHGELVPFGDTTAMARAIAGLLHDPARRRAMGAAARERAHTLFSAEKIVPRYEAHYRALLAT